MDLDTCRKLTKHLETKKTWTTRSLKRIIFDLMMGKDITATNDDEEGRQDDEDSRSAALAG